MIRHIQNKEKCPRCGKDKIVTDAESGEVFCTKCGFVIEEKVYDSRPERTFTNSTTNKAHTGDKTSLTRHDRGLSTIINPLNKDSTGSPLSTSMKSSLSRLRKWDSRSRVNTNEGRNLQHAMAELLKMKEKLSLSDAIVEKAAYTYRKALEKSLIKGRSISALVAATLYAACRESGTPRTLNEVSDSLGIKRKELKVCYRMLIRELGLKMPVVNSTSCISKIASIADLSEKTKRQAMKILKMAEKENALAGKDPMGLAAASLYLASIDTGEHTTQKIIALSAGITEVTVRNRCKNFREIMN